MNSKLQLRRDQIEELSQVKNLLTKLQVVFDLPRRLRAALDRSAHEIAADAYADAAPLLKRYGHKAGPNHRCTTAELLSLSPQVGPFLSCRACRHSLPVKALWPRSSCRQAFTVVRASCVDADLPLTRCGQDWLAPKKAPPCRGPSGRWRWRPARAQRSSLRR